MTKKFAPAMHLPSSLLQDATKEPLQIIIKPYQGITHVPAELSGRDVASFVFIELNKCFKKAGFVAEGLIGNIVWGFEECGFDPQHVAAGLTKLRTMGYIRYSDPLGSEIHEFNFDPKKPIWVRYTDKMIALFVRGQDAHGLILPSN
jgi:hypothetical protein